MDFKLFKKRKGLGGKESTCQCRRCWNCRFDPWAGKVSLRRKWLFTLVFLPGESHGHRSLVGYSPLVAKSQKRLSDFTFTFRYADDTTLMAESEEELKRLLMKVKEESEKVGLNLNTPKTKIMASGPITSWETDGETGNSVRLYFSGLQNHCRW